MTSGPKHKWISPEIIGIFNIMLFILCLFIIIFISIKSSILLLLLLLFSTYLITQTVFDFFEKFKIKTLIYPELFLILDLRMLIFSISLNQIFSVEESFNARVGDERKFKNYTIKFNNLETFTKNFKSAKGYFEIIDNKNSTTKISRQKLEYTINLRQLLMKHRSILDYFLIVI